MHILVASSSVYRQGLYRDVIEGLGCEVSVAGSGVECADRLRTDSFDLLVLEAPLLWGGSDGVLEFLREAGREDPLPVILVAAGAGTIDWFQLSRFHVDDLLLRVPTVQELGRAIASVATSRSSAQQPARQSQRV
jgi:CheY-like chemotaxis protein